MRGAPNDLSRTTLRPLGPSVTLTALLRISTPRSILSRASTPNLTSLADIMISVSTGQIPRSARLGGFLMRFGLRASSFETPAAPAHQDEGTAKALKRPSSWRREHQ